MHTSLITTFAAALAVASPSGVTGAAPVRPLPQYVISRGAVTHAKTVPAPRSPHDVSGAIVTLRSNVIALKLRSGRIVPVDATDAIASGRFSAPLYVGKLVDITGAYDAKHVLHAETITRVPRVNASTPADR